MLISIEGIDGSGKTYLINELQKVFTDARFVREPGGSHIGEYLREHLESSKFTERSKLLMFLLSRSLLMDGASGLTISDRSEVSSLVYNSSKFSMKALYDFHRFLKFPGLDVILYLDVKPNIALQRIKARGEKDTLENLEMLNKKYKEALTLYEKNVNIFRISNNNNNKLIQTAVTILDNLI